MCAALLVGASAEYLEVQKTGLNIARHLKIILT
jgi:hypothetical protein